VVEQATFIEALEAAKQHLDKYFDGKIVPLGELQRHVRGDRNLAVGGAPDVLAAMYSEEAENGRFHTIAGESYIELVRFSKEGVEIESVNAYGASARPESPHFNDQMPLYVRQKTKKMSLDPEKVKQQAVRSYHPQ